MMTSLLVDKSVIVKIKIIKSFMNDFIIPPCNSLLATFVKLSFKIGLKKASFCLMRLVRPRLTISQLFRLLFSLPLLMSPKRKLLESEARRVL